MPRTLLKVFSGFCFCIFCFYATLHLFNYFDVPTSSSFVDAESDCPKGRKNDLSKPFAVIGGYAYKAALPELANLADSPTDFNHSRLIICEGDYMLWPGHKPFAEISERGAGRYIHYGIDVVFSSSDNTDPNSNGRQYTAVIPIK